MPPPRPFLVRVALATVRVFGIVVPRRDRGAWRQEWESEILHQHTARMQHRHVDWREQMSLVRRSLGSFFDAAWLRRQLTADSEVFQDIRHGLRVIRARLLVFAIATTVLAFALGAVAAMGTALYHFVLQPLPYPDATRLVTLWQSTPTSPRSDVAPANFLDWRERSRSFVDIAAVEPWSIDLTERGEPEVVFAVKVTPGFFDVIGLAPALGRTFRADDHQPGRDRVVVVSDGFWRRRLGGDPRVIGRRLAFDGQPYEVIGVLRPDLELGLLPSYRSRDAWLPHVIEDQHRRIRTGGWWNVIARIKPDRSVVEAQAELDAVSATLAREYPKTNEHVTAVATPLGTYLRSDVDRPLLVLGIAAVLVLLVACANVANLLLTLGVARTRELAVRGALGASRARLVRQLLTESFVVTACGVVAGILLAAWALHSLAVLIPATVPRAGRLAFGGATIVSAALAGVVAMIACGVFPAVASTRPALDSTLRDSRTSTGTRSRRRVRDGLAAAELALTLVLLAGSGLLLRSFLGLTHVDPGFTADQVVALQVFAWDHHPTPESRALFFQETLDRIRPLPGVVAAGAVSAMPFIESNIAMRTPVTVEGRPPLSGRDAAVFLTIATPDYFSAMRIPLRRGRAIAPGDRAGTGGVVVISDATARRFWSDADPVGSWMTVTFEGKPRRVQVVGVVGDVRHDGLDGPARAELYLPHAQAPFGSMTYVARVKGAAAAASDAIRAQVWAVDPLQTFYDVVTLDGLVSRSVIPQRLGLSLVGLLAIVAVLVSAIGVYGVISFTTSLRTQEIGVRMALGATAPEILRLVLGHGMFVAAAGLAAGLGGALAFGHLLQGLLFGVSPRDPLTLVAGVVVLGSVAVLASWLPARRASRVDPAVALRF